MRSKTFRRKNKKMSRTRQGGQERPTLTRHTTGELLAMEEGQRYTPSIAQRPTLTRTDSQEFDIEEGRANPQVAIDVQETPNERSSLMRSNSGELDAMETGSVDIESGFGSRKGGKNSRKSRKSRKSKKTRKGKKGGKGGKRGKSRKSNRR